MKDKFTSYFRSKNLTFLTLIAVFLGFAVFISNDLMGKSNEKEKCQETNTADKRKLQSSKPSKNLQKTDACVKMGVAPQEQIIQFPDYGELDPFAEMLLMQKRMDRLFDSTFSRFRRSPGFVLKKDFNFVPKMDISEDKDKYIIRMDLPGMKKADIKITFKGKTLVISGKREKEIKNTKDNKAISYECSYGEFTRMCSLPGPFDKSKTKAKYDKGVLTVTIAKLPEKKEKEISVKVE